MVTVPFTGSPMSRASKPMIQVQHVSKLYDQFVALQDVNLNIEAGEIVGLLGPNGAGKTTLIRSLTGYFEPSGGTITIDGVDVVQDPVAVQRIVGYLPEATPLYPEMLVQEYLDMVADLRNIPPGDPRLRLLAEAVWATGLDQHLTKPIGALSKGFRQRVGLAQAILHKPKVLILDEPTSGLDPSQVVLVRDLIRELAQHSTVLFSTHILSEVEQVCERAVVLLGGRIQLDQKLSELTSTAFAKVAVAADGLSAGEVREKLSKLPGVGAVKPATGASGYHCFQVEGGGDLELGRQLFRLAKESGWELGELSPVRRDLETVFRELVRDHAAGLERDHTTPPQDNVHQLEEVEA